VIAMIEKGKPGEEEDLELPLVGDDKPVIEPIEEKNLLAGDHIDTTTADEDLEPEPEDDAYAALEAQFKNLESERNRAVAERDNERRRIAELEHAQSDAKLNEMQNHKLIIEHAIAATNTELEEAKRGYRQARELGDVDSELAATEALSDARDKLRQLSAGHHEVSRLLEIPQTAPQRPAAPAGDPVEQMITANFPNPKDQEWLRAHRDDIFGNEDRKQLAIAVERAAQLKGIKAGTDEYYAYLDREMGYEEAPQQTPAPRPSKPAAPAPQEKRKAPLPGAPVSRSSNGSAEGVERASPALKQLAADLGMTVSEYMANDRKIRAGKSHHRYT
jgi:hypothetical protein